MTFLRRHYFWLIPVVLLGLLYVVLWVIIHTPSGGRLQ